MLDIYSPEPFNGAERFKKFCSTVDEIPAAIPKVRYAPIVNTVVPRSGLFDIYKRTTNLSENKCVGIGFTYAEAEEFVNKRLKTKVNHQDTYVAFYDIVEQGNEEAKNPLWNSKEIMVEIDKYAN